MPVYTHRCTHGHETRDVVMPMADAGEKFPLCQICSMTMRRVYAPAQVIPDTLKRPHRFIDLPSLNEPGNTRACDEVDSRSGVKKYLRLINERTGSKLVLGDA